MSKTTLPGVIAQHAIITDTCRTARGDNGAWIEAERRLREAYYRAAKGWKIGEGAKIHVVIVVERPT